MQTGPDSIMKLLTKFLRHGVRTNLGFVGRGELFKTQPIFKVSVRCFLFTDTVFVRCVLFTDTVSVNNLFHKGNHHFGDASYHSPVNNSNANWCYGMQINKLSKDVVTDKNDV